MLVIDTVATKGNVRHFIIHARQCWLKGLDPKKNRNLPPLKYDVVYDVMNSFPELKISVNGGIKSLEQCKEHLREGVVGVMIGRQSKK